MFMDFENSSKDIEWLTDHSRQWSATLLRIEKQVFKLWLLFSSKSFLHLQGKAGESVEVATKRTGETFALPVLVAVGERLVAVSGSICLILISQKWE